MDWHPPLFRDLLPKLTERLWFNVDKPADDDQELAQLEHEHTNWLNSIAQRNCDMAPIGKTATENQEEEEDDEEEDDNDDDDTDTHEEDEDDDMEMEGGFPNSSN